MSSEALAREISALVSESLGGAPLDVTAKGDELAERYPELGMSGELIAKAIERTAEMMQTLRSRTIKAPPAPDSGEEIAIDARDDSEPANDTPDDVEVAGQERAEYANGRAHYSSRLDPPLAGAYSGPSPKVHAAMAAAARLSEAPIAFLRRAFSRA